LERLIQRGLQGVQLIVSDDHAGLKKARRAVFGGTPWQRCHFHLQQNAGAYVPRKAMHTEVADDIRMIFNAQDRSTAEMMLKTTVSKYEKTAPRLSMWLEENIPEGLTFYDFPRKWWRKIRKSNNLERVSEEVKRRTRVVRIFPNPDSCLRLVSAVLMEISEAWLTGKVYLNIEDL
jgi:putative transposase